MQDGGTSTENFERYYSTIVPLLKESAMLRCIHVMGGKHLVTFAKQKASSVPQDVLQKVIVRPIALIRILLAIQSY
jgi:hypothetical protein